tara:strand:- start:350 stop:544 length:195 start_codon:yes stop_codon:yes gene_type:complete
MLFIDILPLKIVLNPTIVFKRSVLPIPFGPVMVTDCPETKLKFISLSITLLSTEQNNEFKEIEL